MTKTILIFILFQSTFQLFGQNLTMSQIVELRKKNLSEVEEFLTKKGWEFFNAEEKSYLQLPTVTFTYKKDYMSDRAESFLNYNYDDYPDSYRITIQVNDKDKYIEYLNSIKGYGCKIISSKVVNNEIIKVYRGATTTFEVHSRTSKNYYNYDTAIWLFILFSNQEYDDLNM